MRTDVVDGGVKRIVFITRNDGHKLCFSVTQDLRKMSTVYNTKQQVVGLVGKVGLKRLPSGFTLTGNGLRVFLGLWLLLRYRVHHTSTRLNQPPFYADWPPFPH
jgi:hypothetical protein